MISVVDNIFLLLATGTKLIKKIHNFLLWAHAHNKKLL